jgi:hypothetical protein
MTARYLLYLLVEYNLVSTFASFLVDPSKKLPEIIPNFNWG